MLISNSVFNQFSKEKFYNSLIRRMEKDFCDFPDVQKKYNQAMAVLQKDLGEKSVKKEKEAICQQIASTLFFSGVLGILANLNYYLDPVAGNFLHTDPETYLREKSARKLPEYEAAQGIRKKFYAGLTDTQRQIYDDVTEYVCYLETVGPKIAHFYGFVLGNELLLQVVPGYHPDMALTLQYCLSLEKYFGAEFDWNSLLRSAFAIE